MGGGIQDGWGPDPAGRHEERYFSSGRPTPLVRDGGVNSSDPAGGGVPSPASIGQEPVESRDPPPGAGEPAPSEAPLSWAAAMRYLPAEPEQPASHPRRRRRLLAAGTAFVTVAVSVVVALLSQSGSHHSMSPTMAPAAFVGAAAQQTIDQNTADMTLAGTVQIKGRSVPIQGGGEVDFANHALDLQVNLEVSGQSAAEDLRFVDHNMFVGLSIDGVNPVLQQTGTASWLEMPIAQFLAEAQAGSNPASTLSLLESQGAVVRRIGTKQIGGINCFGFSATLTAAMMVRGQKLEAAALGLTPAQKAQLLDPLKVHPPTITLWIDQHELLRQMTESIQIAVGASGSVSGQLILGFEDYGSAVHVAPPPTSQVIGFQAYINKFGV